MLHLQSRDVELALEPWRGGGVLSFRWRGIDVFRPSTGTASPLDLASFPLVPFCNRIANGHVMYANERRMLPTSPHGIEPLHALHGIGWTSPWAVKETRDDHAVLTLRNDGMLWPWAFEAEQHFDLAANGYCHTISMTNHDRHPMPAGLGLHPYFPRAGAVPKLEPSGVWKTGSDRLPEEYTEIDGQPDWFASAGFDDCFTGCGDTLSVGWPTHRLTIHPSPNLPFTHIYTPPGEDFFCVEPVSHIPDAVNSGLDRQTTGLLMLEPGQSLEISCRFELEEVR